MNLELIIINYNTAPNLKACLMSIRAKLGDVSTMVVDNGSSDGSQEMVGREFPWVKLVENPGNPGYAHACNTGLRASDTQYVLILNSDVEFLGNELDGLLTYMDVHQDVAVAGPKLVNDDGTRQMSCRRFPSMLENVFHGFIGDVWPGNPFSKSYQMKELEGEEPCEVDWVSGAAMLLRRAAVDVVGGFDEGYFMYVEDVDLCWRLREAGFRVVFYPGIELVHHIGRASEQHSLRMHYEHHKSMYRFFSHRYWGWRKYFLFPIVVIGLGFRFLFRLLLDKLRMRKPWG